MKTSVILLAFGLLACSVCEINGQCQDIDDVDLVTSHPEKRMEQQLPGTCWACKWALNKVKKSLKDTSRKEEIKSKLLSICQKIGLLKSVCLTVVKQHLSVLIEELSTTDDVRTICVNIKACKPKEDLDLSY
ncbi:hypothetical protein DPEC_G00317110 [Dallia pectoralis]|uniref:Uncharacterized protein n=1 Tax=Dallia pectoralis TaxID=75939 RepID=A0ACC2FD52_DALPE|nr:hypothetical protein DPEC_G00317110 [Dallia pectoralis]